MSFLATTRGAILRGGATEDALGDEVAGTDVAPAPLDDFPLSVIERSREVFDQSTGTPRTITTTTGRMPAFELEDGDRVRDLRTGEVYAIDSAVRVPRGIAGASTLTLTLRLT